MKDLNCWIGRLNTNESSISANEPGRVWSFAWFGRYGRYPLRGAKSSLVSKVACN